MNTQNPKISYIYALSAVLLWSSVATAFKISLSYLNPLQLLFVSALTSWVVLLILAFFTKELEKLKSIPKKQVFMMLFLGLINPFTYYLVLFKAYDLLPAQEAQALNYTWALSLSYLGAFILKQRLKTRDILAGLICYGGVFVIATKGQIDSLSFSEPLGVALALFSTLLWAYYWIFSAKYSSYPVLGLLLNFTSGFVLIFIAMIFTGGFDFVDARGVLGGVYVGIFEMGFTFFLWLKALKYAKNVSNIANLIFLSPFLSLVFIAVFLKEEILASTFIGLVFIVAGLLLQKRGVRG